MKLHFPCVLSSVIAFGLLVIQDTASGQEAIPDHPMMSDRFFIGLGGVYADSDVTASLESARTGLGTRVDFEDDLGLDENNVIGMLTFRWRFANRWHLDAEYFSLDRDSERVISRTLDWGDLSIPVNASVRSQFDFSDVRLGVSYALFRTKDKEIGIGLGAHVADLEAALATDNFGSEAASESAPLPFATFYARVALTDRWLLSIRVDRLSLDTGDVDGSIFSSGTDLIYQPWRHVSIGLGYRDIDFQASFDSEKWRGEAQIQQNGPYLFVASTF